MVEWILETSDTLWYVSPTFGLAKKTIWEEQEMLPSIMPGWNDPRLVKKRETDGYIEYLPTGGKIYLMGADRPDLMRGPNPYGGVCDEYAVMKPEVWERIIQPIMLSNPDGWWWFLFTPRGKNHAWEAFQRGLDPTNPDWNSSKLTIEDSQLFKVDKSQISDAGYKQELMCEFLEGEGTVFRHVRPVMTEQPRQAIPGHLYVMGVDLAKVQDYTVIVVYDRQTNKQVYQDRFQTIEWPFQKAKIQAIARQYNNAFTVIDATGIGDPISDDLRRSGVSVEPYKLTNQSKKDIIEKLVIWIEQRKLNLIYNDDTLFELENYSYEVTKTGLVTYNAPQGMHDDIVIAQALAVSQLNDLYKNDIMQPKTRIQAFYQDLTKDMDKEEAVDYSEWNGGD